MSDAVYLLSCLAAIILVFGLNHIYKTHSSNSEQDNKWPGLIVIVVSIMIAIYLMFV